MVAAATVVSSVAHKIATEIGQAHLCRLAFAVVACSMQRATVVRGLWLMCWHPDAECCCVYGVPWLAGVRTRAGLVVVARCSRVYCVARMCVLFIKC